MENKKYILDSNIYIAAYLKDDTLHEKALLAMKAVSGNEVLLPHCIIAEVCTVLTYKESKQRALDFLLDMEKTNNIIWLNNSFTEELNEFKKMQARISFQDCSILFLCNKWDAQLISLDKQLLKLYKKSASR